MTQGAKAAGVVKMAARGGRRGWGRRGWGRAGLLAAGILGLAPAPALGQIVGLGALGDSLSDEYFEQNYGAYARNWSVLLTQQRGVNLGPTAAQAGQPGNTWGEPRRTGYRYNFARYGDDSVTMLSNGQHTGAAAEVAAGRVSHVVIAIGTNDYSFTTNAFSSIYNNNWTQAQIDAYADGVYNRIVTAITTVSAASNPPPRILLCGVIDYSVSPLTVFFYGNGTRRESVAAAVAQLNRRLRQFALANDLVYLDTYHFARAIFGPNTALSTSFPLGGRTLNIRQTSSSSGTLAGFVGDAVHPQTTLQGLFANLILAGLGTDPAAGVTLFSEQEILSNAGLTYGGSDTAAARLGPYYTYVLNARCPGDVNADGFVDDTDFTIFAAAYDAFNCPGGFTLPMCPSDLNSDGFVDDADFTLFAAAYDTFMCP